MSENRQQEVIVHATCVALADNAVLIRGPSGSGKSGLALQLMALGCQLVSDDGTLISKRDGVLFASAPLAIQGRIEARGVGLLAAEVKDTARLMLVVDLDQLETQRLPAWHSTKILDCTLPLLHRVESAYFPAAILQYLKAARVA